jgi:hypothetical protein
VRRVARWRYTDAKAALIAENLGCDPREIQKVGGAPVFAVAASTTADRCGSNAMPGSP